MQCVWEQTGVLCPIYRLLGQGVDNKDTARKLNLAEVNAQTCIASIVYFVKLTNRQDLVLSSDQATDEAYIARKG